MVQDERLHWQLNTARDLGDHLPTIHVSFIDESIKFTHFVRPSGWKTLFKQLVDIKKRTFTNWKIICFLPFDKRFDRIYRLNRVINLKLIKSVIPGECFFISPEFGESIVLAKSVLKPKKMIGDVFDVFSTQQLQDIARVSDAVLVSTDRTAKLARKYSSKVYKVSAGYFSDKLLNSLHDKKFWSKSKNILYIGTICWRSNFELLDYIAAQLTDYTVTVIGPDLFDYYVNNAWDQKNVKAHRQWETLKKRKNVKYIPITEQNDLINIQEKFSVAVIPYDMNHMINRNCHPIKFYHYSAMGLPIVSGKVYALEKYASSHVSLVENANEFIPEIQRLAKKNMTSAMRERGLTTSITQSYETKTRQILDIIGQELS